MFNNKKKKAFTLTELLIVVIIIGVLAAVVLPKFNKVMETRKTTEAEEMMAAVRTEQEYRCAMDKPYLGDIDKLTSLESQNRVGGLQVVTKNYTYELEPSGILARSASKEYNLKMPSYADGRVCCEGNDCSSLNKDYPLCSELTTRSDFQVATECTAESAPAGKACVGVPQKFRSCPEGCGTQSRTATCNTETGAWEYSAWSPACEERLPDVTEDCACGHRTKTAQCNTSTGQWEYGDWDKTCTDPETETVACDEDEGEGEKTRTQICNEELGKWTYEGAEWDTSGCVPKDKLIECAEWGDWHLYDNGYDTYDSIHRACADFGMDVIDSHYFSTYVSENATLSEWAMTCCANCPEGTVVAAVDGEGKCVSCDEAYGPNYYWDDSTKSCKPRFQPSQVQFKLVGDRGGGVTLLANFRETNSNPCEYNYTGTEIWSGACPENMSHVCDQCDASADTCTRTCYNQQSYDRAYSSVVKYIPEGQLYQAGECNPVPRDAYRNASLVGFESTGNSHCSFTATCKDGCRNKARRGYFQYRWSGNTGAGFDTIFGCLMPNSANVTGYQCTR